MLVNEGYSLFDAPRFLKQNAGFMARRLIGVVLAVVALAAAFHVSKSDAVSARLAVEQANDVETSREADAVIVEVLALPKKLSDTATRAATLKTFTDIIATNDANTLVDLIVNEAPWEPFRTTGPTAVFIGDTLVAQSGQAPTLIDLTSALAKKAQGGSEASGLFHADGHVWLVAAHAGPPTPNSLPVAVVIAQQLTKDALLTVAGAHSAWLELSVGGLLVSPPGAKTETPVMPSLAKRPLIEGVELTLRRDVSDSFAQLQAKTDRFRLSSFGLAGLFAVAMLAFAFWPKNKEQEQQAALLKQTAEELRQSRVELTNLTNRVTQSGNFAMGSGPVNGDAAATSATVTTAATRYQEVMPLGEGGMARVSIAVARGAEGFRRYFVVKRLKGELAANTEMVNQFIDEARLTASLVHSNVIPVFDFGRDSLGYFLASEYILGRSVERLIERNRELKGTGLDPAIVRFIGQEGLKALSYAHGKADEVGKPLGLVHRDVSPANLLVSAQGEVKLLDFGIVKSEARLNKTQAGIVKGNLFYMSPEQAMAQPVDPRADVFSLGMVLFTAATGQTLYAAETVHELLTRGAHGPTADDFKRIANVPGGLGPVLARAVAVDRNQRFATAEEFLSALTASGPVATSAELRALVQALVGPELETETQSLQEAK